MGMRRIIFFTISMFLLLIASNSYSAWQGPTEVIVGSWGERNIDFGLAKGDTSDRFASLAAILFDGRIVISDQIIKREVIYNNDGSLLKVVPWYIDQNGSKITNPEYSSYQYWNVQGYTIEGNVWIKIDDYLLKSPTGELLQTSTERPLELGIITSKEQPDGNFAIKIKYPDKEYNIVYSDIFDRYFRDPSNNIYGIQAKKVVGYDQDNNLAATLTLPVDEYGAEIDDGVTTWRPVTVEYGEPVLDANGNVYCWSRTSTHYKILKWTWQD